MHGWVFFHDFLFSAVFFSKFTFSTTTKKAGILSQCQTILDPDLGPMLCQGAQWLSGRVLDSRPKGRGFEPHRRHCVVSLSKNINPSLVLVQPRKTHPFITERLLMGRKESNQTKQNQCFVRPGLGLKCMQWFSAEDILAGKELSIPLIILKK